ncbi:ubiquitin-conjugating enzyme E2 C isoform X3 [Pteronotus mesoamericanus]|uniref:ubiquitin-conjugating enzyme E2 C isoform X3 n=1 Tax=Pteronotus mesoamericanus TaxID=1884717 RepID=UPI0023EBB154|nr:ubiquitin-conjugating enzyme E2 C isoform X3 [Pteronotus parnellii mesoamericanus]
MASQNRDPAAASVTATRKGAEPSGGAARGPVGKRLQQELMTLMVSESLRCKTIFCQIPKKLKGPSKPLMRGLGWDMRFRVTGLLPASVSPMPEPNIDSPLNTHAAELWKNPTAFKKYVQETYAKHASSQEP